MKKLKIDLIDADMLDRKTTHPNLALMKISAYHKKIGHDVNLVKSWGDIVGDKIYISKVFSWTKVPIITDDRFNIGGTGFFGSESPRLPEEIEHIKPDYNLYGDHVKSLGNGRMDRLAHSNYQNFSIGFLTRGCFRKCDFCVNRNYSKVEIASDLSEFLDVSRPYIRLWDDNFLGFPDWERLLNNLKESRKSFVFQQGLDVRIMTEKKAKALLSSNYWHNDYIFAFDSMADVEEVKDGLNIWSSVCPFSRKGYYAKVFVLCAFPDTGIKDVIDTLERVNILSQLGYLPYIMRHENWKESPNRSFYVAISAWCNMPHRFLKYSFRDFVVMFGKRSLGRNVSERILKRINEGEIPDRLISRPGKLFFDSE